MNRQGNSFVFPFMFILIATLACGISTGRSNASSDELRQWAVSASASSEFGEYHWSAEQAIGAPDTIECGNQETAWASMYSNGMDWLEIGFSTPVIPTQINIHETFNPGSVFKVEVRSEDGSFYPVWQGEPKAVSQCPRVFPININNIDFKVTAVMIHVDQSIVSDWDEIDAVELVGMP